MEPDNGKTENMRANLHMKADALGIKVRTSQTDSVRTPEPFIRRLIGRKTAWLLGCPRRESNSRTRFRKPLLYPLSYGG